MELSFASGITSILGTAVTGSATPQEGDEVGAVEVSTGGSGCTISFTTEVAEGGSSGRDGDDDIEGGSSGREGDDNSGGGSSG